MELELQLSIADCYDLKPSFKTKIAEIEDAVFNTETNLRNLIKLVRISIDSLKDLSNKNTAAIEQMLHFSSQQKESASFEKGLNSISQSLLEVEKSRGMMGLHFEDAFIHPIEKIIKDEFECLKDQKRLFEKAHTDYLNSLNKFLSKRPNDPTSEEAAKELRELRELSHKASIDYVHNLNKVNSTIKYNFLDNAFAFIYAQFAFFHQGYEILKDLEKGIKSWLEKLNKEQSQVNQLLKEEEEKIERVLRDSCYDPLIPSTSCPRPLYQKFGKEGYMFRKGNQRLIQYWQRLYYKIENGNLIGIQTEKTILNSEPLVEEINLRLCLVRKTENPERPYCFELVSPSRVYQFQAESNSELSEWIEALVQGIAASFNSEPSKHRPSVKPQMTHQSSSQSLTLLKDKISSIGDLTALQQIFSVPGNKTCVDCGMTDPEWASTNLGVVLCIECSGVHRSLGVHLSKVRSLKLDKWEPSNVEVMMELGNDCCNAIFEAKLETKSNLITPTSSRRSREQFILDKYIEKKYVDFSIVTESTQLHSEFWESIHRNDLKGALKWSALGADINWKNPDACNRTPIMEAIMQNKAHIVEFLFQWSADIHNVDTDGWTAVHHVVKNNNVRLFIILVKKGANFLEKNKEGKTPEDIAESLAHVDLLTLLRLVRMRAENEKTPKWSPEDDNRLEEMLNLFMSQFPDTTGGWKEGTFFRRSSKSLQYLLTPGGKSDERNEAPTPTQSRMEKFQSFLKKNQTQNKTTK